MGYQYTQAQVDQIKVLYDLGDFPAAYNLAANFADGNAGSDQPSVLWLRGAAKINAGIGSESAFIRGYTAAQYLARFGQALDLDLIQAASDAIATKVLDDIINGKSLPSIGAIAIDDATPAANMIFNGSMGGWAGNPLFLFLGYNQTFFDNVLHQQDASIDTYDALAMIKFLGSTGTFFDNLSNSLGAIGLNPGAAVTVANAGLALNSYLEDAYGGQNLNGQVSTAEVILGRVSADDTIVGTAGRDFIHGGGGDDTILASGGNDLIDGGAGNDTADYSSVSTFMNVVIKAETSGVPYTGSITSATGGFDTLFAVENIIGGGGDDLFMVQSLPAHLTSIAGGEGVDELNTFYLPAAVNIDAVAGTLTSGGESINISGFEKIEGTGASDTFILSGIETEIRGGGGSDTVDLSQSPGSGAPLRLFDVETIIASEQADILILSGGSTQTVHGRGGNDEIDGGDGPSHLFGEAGRDILRGGAGSDELFGGDEDDELHGGDGADLLDGGDGADWMIGGSDGVGDTFQVNGGDFAVGGSGSDTFNIDGAGVIFGGSGGGDLYNIVGDDVSVLMITVDGADWTNGSEIDVGKLRSALGDRGADVILINVGSSDTIKFNGQDIGDVQYGLLAQEVSDGEYSYDGQILHNFSGYVPPERVVLGGNEYYNSVHTKWSEYTQVLSWYGFRQGELNYAPTVDVVAGTRNIVITQSETFDPRSEIPEATLTISGFVDEIAGISFSGNGVTQTQLVDSIDYSVQDWSWADIQYFTNIWGTIAYGYFDVAPTAMTVIGPSSTFDEYGQAIDDDFYQVEDHLVLSFEDVRKDEEPIKPIEGTPQPDQLVGTSDSEDINGYDSADLLDGNGGVDGLYAGLGNDTYRVAAADSHVTIWDEGGYDQLVITRVADAGDISMSFRGQDLLIAINGTDESIQVLGGLVRAGAQSVEQVTVASTTWYYDDILAQISNATSSIVGTADADFVLGTSADQSFSGLEGDDWFEGAGGADAFDGGDGEDTVSYANAGAAVTVDVVTPLNSLGDAFGDTFVAIEKIVGSAFDDVITVDGGVYVEAGAGDDTVSGGSGSGGAGNDALSGSSAADYITGDNGDDSLNGGDGDDALDGGDGNDTIFGGDGVDHLSGGLGNDLLLGGAGNDTYSYDGADIIVEGSNEGDADSIYIWNEGGLAAAKLTAVGLDLLIEYEESAPGANDATSILIKDQLRTDGDYGIEFFEDFEANVLTKADIVEILRGSVAGNITGTASNDSLFGTALSDVVFGESGDDIVLGAEGNDVLIGGIGDDALQGDEGDDQLLGGDGADWLHGGVGNDRLDGGDGDDYLIGGSGADTFVGGTGDDTASYVDAGSAVEIHIGREPSTFGGDAQGDTFSQIEAIRGSSHDDVISANLAGLTLYGGDGNDVLSGLSVAITLRGEDGHDSLIGSTQADTIFGGAGNDGILSGAGEDAVDGGTGDDVILGGDAGDSLQGGDGDDIIYGEEGEDWLHGGNGNDTLSGGAGDDYLVGAGGADAFIGNEGVDVASYVDAATAVSLNTGLGASSYTGDALGDTFVGIEVIRGSDYGDNISAVENGIILLGGLGDDTLTASGATSELNGEEGDDALIGGAGNDMIFGGVGNDTVSAGSGDDGIQGEDGNDEIHAGAGDDWAGGDDGDDILYGDDGVDYLSGGLGADTLYGGAGNDRFTYASTAESVSGAIDRIMDFTTGDRVRLVDIDANDGVADDQAFVLDIDSSFSAGEIRQTVVGSDLLLELNVDGEITPEMSILIVGRTTALTNSDFIF